jgi:CPA2 family monovalent cation:H+ antiporter-2
VHDFILVKDIVIILLVSLPIIFLFKKLNVPSIVGFLLAGMLIGPSGFELISGLKEIEIMAEIGVVLLLFTIGLEVSFSHLMRIKKYLIYAGGAQVFLTIILSAIIFLILGIPLKSAIYFGMLLSLSSTAIVLKLLADRDELETPQGKISIGVLIFQDLIIVPMFLILPIIGSDTPLSFGEISLKLLFAFGLLATVLVLSKYLMPKIIYQLAKMRMREAFTIGILLLILGTGYLTHMLGLSMALGAFIAGLILAESDYHTQILSDIMPIKDAFNSIFFVSVGLLLNINFVLSEPLLISFVTLGIIVFKSSIIIGIILLLKSQTRIAILTGIGLAQVGEFSFVLAQAGNNFNLMSEQYFNIYLASSVFTMILTPFLFKITPAIAFRGSDIASNIKTKSENDEVKLNDHVIIAGFGLNGRNLAHVLKETGINYVVVELNPDTVAQEKQNGEKIVFGDISRQDVLKEVKINDSQVIVFTIPDPLTIKRALATVKALNPNIYAVVRTRYVSEVEDLNKIGADVVIPEEFETSLEMFRNVLRKYHIPLNVIMQQTSLLRQESYKLLRKEDASVDSFLHLDEILAQGLTETYFVNDDNPNIGKLLSELNLRSKTDAMIIAIIRAGNTISNPSGKVKIESHDTLVLTGDHNSVDSAIILLNGEELIK